MRTEDDDDDDARHSGRVREVRTRATGWAAGRRSRGAAELLFGRLRRERPGRALVSRRAVVVATAAIADCVWTAADGTPLYRVTRAQSMVTKMAITRL